MHTKEPAPPRWYVLKDKGRARDLNAQRGEGTLERAYEAGGGVASTRDRLNIRALSSQGLLNKLGNSVLIDVLALGITTVVNGSYLYAAYLVIGHGYGD